MELTKSDLARLTSSCMPLGKSTRILLAAGCIPLPWFLVWTSIAGAMVPGYSALSQHASELTLLPGLPQVLLDAARRSARELRS